MKWVGFLEKLIYYFHIEKKLNFIENEKKKIKRNNKPYYTEENFSDKRKKNQTYKKFVDIKAADEKIGIPNEGEYY